VKESEMRGKRKKMVAGFGLLRPHDELVKLMSEL
jgi:hypothetical protein